MQHRRADLLAAGGAPDGKVTALPAACRPPLANLLNPVLNVQFRTIAAQRAPHGIACVSVSSNTRDEQVRGFTTAHAVSSAVNMTRLSRRW